MAPRHKLLTAAAALCAAYVVPRAKLLTAAAALCVAYLAIRRQILHRAERRGERIGPKWLGLLAWRLLNSYSRLMGVRLASEGGEGLVGLDKSRRYLIVWHPHGFLAWSCVFIVSRMAVLGHPHGQEWFAMVAPALFRLPILSEALMLLNGRRVGKQTILSYLEKGKSIAIQPGGVREQMATRHDQEQAVFPANLGFIRMAIKYGLDLFPVYIFQENQMFDRMEGFDGLTKWVYKKSGFGLPFCKAKFGLPLFGLMPKATEVHVRWGLPVEVGPPEENPSDERVEEVFCRYLAGLRRTFNLYAEECLPPAIASRGLKVIRLDGKPVPPDTTAQAPLLDDAAQGGPAAQARL